MGKYEEKLKPVAMGIVGKQADAEIAALEARVKELEGILSAIKNEEPLGYIREKDIKLMENEETSSLIYPVKVICADGNHYAVPVYCDVKSLAKYKALLARVEAHNDNVRACEIFTDDRFIINTLEEEE